MKNKTKNEYERLRMATKYSIDGFKVLLREAAFKSELAIGVLHFALLLTVHTGIVLGLILCLEYVSLLIVEAINTAIEKVVDLCSPEWNELAKQAKDVSSAAVCMILFVYLLSWGAVLVRGLKW